DPGADATDNCDTALPAVTVDSSDIDNTTFGSYVVTYNLLDAAENAAVEVTRTVKVVPKLTIANTNAGNTTPPAGSHLFELNTVVQLAASPAANFSHWEGDDIHLETDNPISITMNADKSITAVFNAAAYFPDPNLEQAVRDAIDKPSGAIEFSDLEGVTSLDGSGYGIQDLTGLEQLADLTDLRLNNNSISDLSPVAYLTGLTHLELSNVNPSGIAALGSLTNLTFLDLSENGITDVGDLAGLDSLESLDLSGNDLSELQSFVDAGILAGGTLDLTGNPLEALAYHVYTRLIEGHVSSLSYDDLLGHQTDGLRVLIVGVEQGLGSITINSVPAGGVSQYEFT
ncbi:MAG: leucine-rich repeat domain-containing protein, partial [Gammaproteobacteria bacterium]|nr:leucine-rich repeat domain-containing protein [Gammaproteobacteria bacterium]